VSTEADQQSIVASEADELPFTQEQRVIGEPDPELSARIARARGSEAGEHCRRRADIGNRSWNRFRTDAYKVADTSKGLRFRLIAVAVARFDLNSRGFKCPEEALAQAPDDPLVVEAARRLNAWLKSSDLASLHSITC